MLRSALDIAVFLEGEAMPLIAGNGRRRGSLRLADQQYIWSAVHLVSQFIYVLASTAVCKADAELPICTLLHVVCPRTGMHKGICLRRCSPVHAAARLLCRGESNAAGILLRSWNAGGEGSAAIVFNFDTMFLETIFEGQAELETEDGYR